MTTEAPTQTASIDPETITPEQIEFLIANLPPKQAAESKTLKVALFVASHKRKFVIGGAALLAAGATVLFAAKHKDELHDVIDALPESE